jgi:hypothetical protein
MGIIVFAVGFLSPLLIPIVAGMNLPLAWKATLSGLLSVGVPEVFTIAAIALMGKKGFRYLKSRIFEFFKKRAPSDRVSRTRYRFGLVMFVVPLLFGWLGPYVPNMIPGYAFQRLGVNLCGDLIFVSSLFVLGGDFWDKIRALFIHEATAHLPESKTVLQY